MSQSALDDVWHDNLGRIPTPSEEDYVAARRLLERRGAHDIIEILGL